MVACREIRFRALQCRQQRAFLPLAQNRPKIVGNEKPFQRRAINILAQQRLTDPLVNTWVAGKPPHRIEAFRHGSVADLRWFKGEPAFVFHPMNAHTDGDIVTCDVCEFEQAPLFPALDGTPGDPAKSIPRLTRWMFDLGGNTDDYRCQRLNDIACEFPRLDERYAGLGYRYGYMACTTNAEFDFSVFNGIGRIDHRTGKLDIYDVGAGRATNEPVFVPKSDTAEEGEGFLLANIYDSQRKASELVILDAENVTDGPLAVAYLDHRVPFGFHGNWAAL